MEKPTQRYEKPLPEPGRLDKAGRIDLRAQLKKYVTYLTPAPELDEPDILRRNFMVGGASLVAMAAIPNITKAEEMEVTRPVAREDVERAREAEKRDLDLFIQELPLTWRSFDEKVTSFRAHYERELDSVLEFGSQITRGDEQGRSRLAYLRQALSLPNFSPDAEALIKQLLPAKAMVESGLDASRSSGIAEGILQFTESTWQQHRPSEEANIFSLVDQVAATASLLEEIRQEIEMSAAEALQYIKKRFFADNELEYQTNFLGPICVEAFNAGGRSIAIIINDFYAKVGLTEKIDEILDHHIQDMDLKSKDLLQLIFFMANEFHWGVNFGDDASEYLIRIYAARQTLDSLPPLDKETILGESLV